MNLDFEKFLVYCGPRKLTPSEEADLTYMYKQASTLLLSIHQTSIYLLTPVACAIGEAGQKELQRNPEIITSDIKKHRL